MKRKIDFEEYLNNAWASVYEKLGDKVVPKLEEVKEIWENKCKNAPPKSILFVYNIKNDEIPLWHNLDLIGYEPHEIQSFTDFVKTIHPSQVKLISYLVANISEILDGFGKYIFENNCYYTVLRSITKKNGETLLTLQTSEAFQLDENDKLKESSNTNL